MNNINSRTFSLETFIAAREIASYLSIYYIFLKKYVDFYIIFMSWKITITILNFIYKLEYKVI